MGWVMLFWTTRPQQDDAYHAGACRFSTQFTTLGHWPVEHAHPTLGTCSPRTTFVASQVAFGLRALRTRSPGCRGSTSACQLPQVPASSWGKLHWHCSWTICGNFDVPLRTSSHAASVLARCTEQGMRSSCSRVLATLG
jgi:hypothetical protein